MELNEALAFIHATDWKGSRLGLERMRELMHRLGNPQDSLKFIHVAGTNGKGSTSTMLASILTAAGYKTGLYTSPHLVRVNERFRINGADIPDAALCRAAEAVKEAADGMSDAPTSLSMVVFSSCINICTRRMCASFSILKRVRNARLPPSAFSPNVSMTVMSEPASACT